MPDAARVAEPPIIYPVKEISEPVLRPNRIPGAASAATAPIINSVEGALELECCVDVEMVPCSGA